MYIDLEIRQRRADQIADDTPNKPFRRLMAEILAPGY